MTCIETHPKKDTDNMSMKHTIQSWRSESDADSNENSEVIFNSFANSGAFLKRKSKELESTTEKS